MVYKVTYGFVEWSQVASGPPWVRHILWPGLTPFPEVDPVRILIDQWIRYVEQRLILVVDKEPALQLHEVD